MSKKDYYEILGVSKTATKDEITKAFRRLAMKYHPDRASGKEAEEKFKEIQKAYAVLSDEKKRKEYDQFGEAGFASGGFGAGDFSGTHFDFGDIFSQMFGGGRGPGSREQGSRAVRGADLQYELSVTFKEAALGTTKEIRTAHEETCNVCHGNGAKPGTSPAPCSTCRGSGKIDVKHGFLHLQQTCPECHGSSKIIKDPCSKCHGTGRIRKNRTLQVTIPAGIDDGQAIRLSGEGDAGFNNGPSGDLYIRVHVSKDPFFIRKGGDLHCEVPTSFATAALGGEVNVPLISGHKAELKIPKGSQNGKTLRLKGQGIVQLNTANKAKGDLYCHLYVETPVNLTPRQEELLKEFQQISQELPYSQSPKEKSFFDRLKGFFK